MPTVARLSKLDTLDLTGVKSITEASFRELAGLKELRSLNLAFVPIAEKDLLLLREFKSLRELAEPTRYAFSKMPSALRISSRNAGSRAADNRLQARLSLDG
jgi:hypothetical protein